MWKSDLDRNLKLRFFRACVESILLYGSETWTISRKMELRIDGCYTRLLRRALNIIWKDHITNKILYGDLPKLTTTIRQRRMRFAGHCARATDQPVSELLFWTPSYGKRGKGAGHKTYLSMLKEDTLLKSPSEIKSLMEAKDLWKLRVENVRFSSADD